MGVTMGGTYQAYCDIDTGFTGSINLRPAIFDELAKNNAITLQEDTQLALLHRVRTIRKGTLAELRLVDFTHRNVRVMESDKSSLGLGYLRRYRVTFDLGRGNIHLAKGAQFERTEPSLMLGAGILRLEEKTVIVSPDPNSNASRTGILDGDELISVEGKSVVGKPTAEIVAMIRAKADYDGLVALTLRRNGHTIAVSCAFPKEQPTEFRND